MSYDSIKTMLEVVRPRLETRSCLRGRCGGPSQLRAGRHDRDSITTQYTLTSTNMYRLLYNPRVYGTAKSNRANRNAVSNVLGNTAPFRSFSHGPSRAGIQAAAKVAEPATPPQVRSMGLTKDGRNLKIRRYPEFQTGEEERSYRKQHLAGAFRVFAERGYDEGIAGHISVRDPILTDHFCE